MTAPMNNGKPGAMYRSAIDAGRGVAADVGVRVRAVERRGDDVVAQVVDQRPRSRRSGATIGDARDARHRRLVELRLARTRTSGSRPIAASARSSAPADCRPRQVDGDHQRAVGSWSEAVGQQVVGLPGGQLRRVVARVGEPEPHARAPAAAITSEHDQAMPAPATTVAAGSPGSTVPKPCSRVSAPASVTGGCGAGRWRGRRSRAWPAAASSSRPARAARPRSRRAPRP